MQCRTLSLRAWGIAALAAMLINAWTATCEAQNVVRVEEDWELVVATPDPNQNAPQITSTISPLGNISGVHCVFELNQQTLNSYLAGGLQLQAWNGAESLAGKTTVAAAMLATPGETVTWTQVMDLNGCELFFSVVNGHGATWGEFGSTGQLKVTVNTNLTSLNAYNPAVSVANSAVGYGANRVASLKIKRVRLITANGEQVEDQTERVVHDIATVNAN